MIFNSSTVYILYFAWLFLGSSVYDNKGISVFPLVAGSVHFIWVREGHTVVDM